jgi:hypothetical protein
MGLLDSVFGSSSKVKSKSVLSADQQKLLKDVVSYLQGGLSSGATASQYEAYTGTPSLLQGAFGLAEQTLGTGMGTIVDALMKQASGAPAYSFDPSATTKRFESTYVTPMMSSYKANVVPLLKEAFNLPGMAHSSLMSKGVTSGINQFYEQSIAPRLFEALQTDWTMGIQSAENAATRQLQGATALGALPVMVSSGALQIGQAQLAENERILAALRGEEARMMPEYNPYLQPSMQTALQQTVENIGLQGSSGMLGNLLQAGIGMAGLGNQGVNFTDMFKFFS